MPHLMWRVSYLIGVLCACGAPASVIDGEYDYELQGIECQNGAPATGRMAIYEGQHGALSGTYDVCGSSVAAADLGGRIRGLTFDLTLFGNAVDVIDGYVQPGGVLLGPVSGLGPGVQFKATNRHLSHGKNQPPEGP